ncbi:MAG: rhodanese [Rickettsiales bacterium]|nr:rhodanese [Rickettsiales bacterium]|tara:strand:- start:140 stop:496 length:357 start_codon:yes stop_codon:yes gene_type:complete
MKKSSKKIISQANEEIQQISAIDLKDNEKKFLILDVREKEEIDKDPGIEGSLRIPRGLIEFHADEESPLYDQNFSTHKTIVVYCAVGLRGLLASKTLKDMGYENVLNLEKGLNGWKEL